MKKIRWGILGTGKIAKKFATGLHTLPEAELYAVGSRSVQNAQKFAKAYGVQEAYNDYAALISDPEVDIIYVALPHPFHCEWTCKALENGKAVLCEKPFALNATESQRMIQTARRQNVFLMEAMWTRFLPSWERIMNWIEQDEIGEIRMLKADFGFRAEFDPKDRKFNPDLGGGALLDLGIYPVSLAYHLFKEKPDKMHSLANLGPTGVDDDSAYLFGYKNGAIALLSSAMRTETPKTALIMGSKGQIEVPLFWRASSAILRRKNKTDQLINLPFISTGLQYQAQAVMNCFQKGLKECDRMPLDESQQIMQSLDEMRESWGLKYPGEA